MTLGVASLRILWMFIIKIITNSCSFSCAIEKSISGTRFNALESGDLQGVKTGKQTRHLNWVVKINHVFSMYCTEDKNSIHELLKRRKFRSTYFIVAQLEEVLLL